jgi:hypothetical protein
VAALQGWANTYVGGLAGGNSGTITYSYFGGQINYDSVFKGGVVGTGTSEVYVGDYWDTSTSGITNPAQGVGNSPNAPGITGSTTLQLQSGLPAGFSNTIWGESPSINGGLPYLLAIPPA